MGIMHDEAIKGLLENLQRQEQQQQPQQQLEPDHPQIQVLYARHYKPRLVYFFLYNLLPDIS